MRKLVVAALLTALAVPAPALAVDRQVSMKYSRFTPNSLKALPGDRVIWTNNEINPTTAHNVTSRALLFKSERLEPGQSFEWFTAVGRHSYVCTLHPGMSGSVTVADLHLSGPTTTLSHGASARFTGLAEPGAGVTIHSADGTQVAVASAGGDGGFAASVPRVRPGTYYARSGGVRSSGVKVSVRPRLALTSRRPGTRLVLAVAATPAQAGAPVVVERRAGSRWVRIARGRLNASSKATFRVTRKAMTIRARTTRGVGGYTAAISRAVRVR